MQSSSDVRTMYDVRAYTRKKPTDSEKSRSDKTMRNHRYRKKKKRQIKKPRKPTGSERSRSNKSRKNQRLGRKQKGQIKKKEQIRKRNANNLTLLKTISLATIEVASSVWAYLENVASYKLEILKTYK